MSSLYPHLSHHQLPEDANGLDQVSLMRIIRNNVAETQNMVVETLRRSTENINALVQENGTVTFPEINLLHANLSFALATADVMNRSTQSAIAELLANDGLARAKSGAEASSTRKRKINVGTSGTDGSGTDGERVNVAGGGPEVNNTTDGPSKKKRPQPKKKTTPTTDPLATIPENAVQASTKIGTTSEIELSSASTSSMPSQKNNHPTVSADLQNSNSSNAGQTGDGVNKKRSKPQKKKPVSESTSLEPTAQTGNTSAKATAKPTATHSDTVANKKQPVKKDISPAGTSDTTGSSQNTADAVPQASQATSPQKKSKPKKTQPAMKTNIVQSESATTKPSVTDSAPTTATASTAMVTIPTHPSQSSQAISSSPEESITHSAPKRRKSILKDRRTSPPTSTPIVPTKLPRFSTSSSDSSSSSSSSGITPSRPLTGVAYPHSLVDMGKKVIGATPDKLARAKERALRKSLTQ